jgi:hypothetical protein
VAIAPSVSEYRIRSIRPSLFTVPMRLPPESVVHKPQPSASDVVPFRVKRAALAGVAVPSVKFPVLRVLAAERQREVSPPQSQPVSGDRRTARQGDGRTGIGADELDAVECVNRRRGRTLTPTSRPATP